MRRIVGFEFCDQSWLKGVWREAYLDGLNFLFRLGGIYRGTHRPLARWAAMAGHDRIVELGSGGGQQAATFLAAADRDGLRLPTITLSDRQPDTEAFRQVQARNPGRVEYLAHPVDMTGTDRLPGRLALVCGAFHHLPPDAARAMLANAEGHLDGMFIQEVFARHPLSLLLCLFNLPVLMLAPFFSGRLNWQKALVSTLLPLVPLMIVFDGVMSVLRTYNGEEILAMVPARLRREWHWEIGHCRFLWLLKAPYVFGCLRKAVAAAPARTRPIPAAREEAQCVYS